jgi:hypothetical protein
VSAAGGGISCIGAPASPFAFLYTVAQNASFSLQSGCVFGGTVSLTATTAAQLAVTGTSDSTLGGSITSSNSDLTFLLYANGPTFSPSYTVSTAQTIEFIAQTAPATASPAITLNAGQVIVHSGVAFAGSVPSAASAAHTISFDGGASSTPAASFGAVSVLMGDGSVFDGSTLTGGTNLTVSAGSYATVTAPAQPFLTIAVNPSGTLFLTPSAYVLTAATFVLIGPSTVSGITDGGASIAVSITGSTILTTGSSSITFSGVSVTTQQLALQLESGGTSTILFGNDARIAVAGSTPILLAGATTPVSVSFALITDDVTNNTLQFLGTGDFVFDNFVDPLTDVSVTISVCWVAPDIPSRPPQVTDDSPVTCPAQTPCSPSPCSASGTASCDPTGINPSQFTCTCKAGFSGLLCQTQIDECASDPCINGGTCQDLVDGFNCSCPDGYSGSTCQTTVDT